MTRQIAVRFEKNHGYLRIAQEQDNGLEVILLCPRQVKALLAFAAPKPKSKP